ncbi:MFS transporter [Francisellaceae bacterium]|nr:MFS transporter [Francisellaceae bacterium]
MSILILGNALYTTMTSLDLVHMGVSNFFVGIVATSYFLGMAIGAFTVEKIVARISYIRAYAAFAALMSVVVLLQGMIDSPEAWIILRFLIGYALAGLFVVIESWMIESSTIETKGKIMAAYLLCYYLFQAFGQLLLNINFPNPLMMYCGVAILAIVSIIPVSMTRINLPLIKSGEKLSMLKIYFKAPLGMWSSFISGFLLAIIYTIYPILLLNIGLDKSKIALCLFITIACGALFQIPVGKLSDKYDRRIILLFLGIFMACFVFIFTMAYHNLVATLILSGLIGAVSFAFYPLSISHASDKVEAHEQVTSVAVLTLFFGVGSVIGPLISSSFMHAFGNLGFFITLLASVIVYIIYNAIRVYRFDAVPEDEKVDFVAAFPSSAQEPLGNAIQDEILN